ARRIARLHLAATGALPTVRDVKPLTRPGERHVQYPQLLLECRLVRAAVASAERPVVRQHRFLQSRQEHDPPFAPFGSVNGAEPCRLLVGSDGVDILADGQSVEPLAQADLRPLGDRAQASDCAKASRTVGM